MSILPAPVLNPDRTAGTAIAVTWACLAVVAGVLVGVSSTEIAIIVVVAAVLAVACVINPLAALIAMVVLAPLRTLIATESAFQLPLDIGQLALVAVLASWLLYRMSHRRLPGVRYTPVYIPVGIFVFAAGLSGFTPISMSAWLSEWLKWVQVLLLIALCLDLARTTSVRWLAFALVLAGTANALVGIYQFFGGSGALHLLINDRYFRAFGTFGQPNPFGAFMGLMIPIAFGTLIGYGLRAWTRYRSAQTLPVAYVLWPIFYLICGGVMSVALIMSWSRGAWLGFGASLLILLVALPRRLSSGLIIAVAAGAVLAGLWATGRLPASIVERVSSAFLETFATNDVRGVDINPENYALVERLAHWQAAVNMATEHPLLGVGFGNYEAAYPGYRLINWKYPLGHAHNYYLNVLAETGIVGFISYLGMWCTILWLTWRTRQHPDPIGRLIAAGLLGSWVYLLVHSLTDNLFVNNLFLHLGVMFGMLAVLYNQCQSLGQLRTE